MILPPHSQVEALVVRVVFSLCNFSLRLLSFLVLFQSRCENDNLLCFPEFR